jgi:hypothetical protein
LGKPDKELRPFLETTVGVRVDPSAGRKTKRKQKIRIEEL